MIWSKEQSQFKEELDGNSISMTNNRKTQNKCIKCGCFKLSHECLWTRSRKHVMFLCCVFIHMFCSTLNCAIYIAIIPRYIEEWPLGWPIYSTKLWPKPIHRTMTKANDQGQYSEQRPRPINILSLWRSNKMVLLSLWYNDQSSLITDWTTVISLLEETKNKTEK